MSSITNYFQNLFEIMAEIITINPVYACQRCGLTIINIFDLKEHMKNCLLRNILFQLECSNGHWCSMGSPHFHIHKGLYISTC